MTVKRGPISMGLFIVRSEGFLALYKGLGAVVTAIIPKMAIRFTSFEYYKSLIAAGKPSQYQIFIGMLPLLFSCLFMPLYCL